ncbi:hypothetical protein PMAYCL1PPCAC_02003, partial [Pristionchus mayeri]
HKFITISRFLEVDFVLALTNGYDIDTSFTFITMFPILSLSSHSIFDVETPIRSFSPCEFSESSSLTVLIPFPSPIHRSIPSHFSRTRTIQGDNCAVEFLSSLPHPIVPPLIRMIPPT